MSQYGAEPNFERWVDILKWKSVANCKKNNKL